MRSNLGITQDELLIIDTKQKDQKIEKISKQLVSLMDCISNFNSLVEEIGTGFFQGDAVSHREKIIKEKENGLLLSKEIYSQLSELTRGNTDMDWIEVSKVSPSDMLVKKLQKDHSLAINLFSNAVKKYQARAEKTPLLIKKDRPSATILDLEQVLVFDEPGKEEKEREMAELESIRKDCAELLTIFEIVNQEVKVQAEKMELVSDQIDEAKIKIEDGTINLKQASIMTGFGTTLLGGAIGGLIGGPIGAVAGFKIGMIGVGIASGVTAAGAIGIVSGWFVARKMNQVNGANTPTAEQVKSK